MHLLSLNLQASNVWPEHDTVVRQYEHSVAEPRRIEHEDCGCERPFLAVLALESLVVQRACRDEPRDEEDDHEDAPSMVSGDADLLFVDGRRGCRKHRECDNHRRLEVVAERDELHEMPTPVGQRVVTMKVPVCARGGEVRPAVGEMLVEIRSREHEYTRTKKPAAGKVRDAQPHQAFWLSVLPLSTRPDCNRSESVK